MKSKSVLLLGIVLILLFGYLYLYEMPKQKMKLQEKEAAKQIFRFDQNRLTSFTFAITGKDIILERDKTSGEFVIVEPVSTKTEKGVVKKFLTRLQKIKSISAMEPDDPDLSEFSLDNPLYKITLNFDDGSQKIFNFGTYNVSNNLIYANRSDDEKIYLFSLATRNVLDIDLYLLREKEIFKHDLTDLGEIKIIQNNKTIILTKDGDNWMITSPLNIKADIVQVRALINNLVRLKALKFPDEMENVAGKLNFDEAIHSIILTSTKGDIIDSFKALSRGPVIKKRLSLAELEKEDCFTTGSPGAAPADNSINTAILKFSSKDGVYLVDSNDMFLFFKSVRELRNKPVFDQKMDDVYQIKFSRNNKLVHFIRNEMGIWSNISDKNNPQTLDETTISAIFNYLYFVEAVAFVDNVDPESEKYKKYQFDQKNLTLAFYDKDGKLLDMLFTGKEYEGNIYLKKHNDPTIYMVEKSFIDRFLL